MEKSQISKKKLAVLLSKLESFIDPAVKSEQYATDSEIAAEVLHYAFMHGDVEGKDVADLGSGTGILGIGALILGAKRAYFLDNDMKALEALVRNIVLVENSLGVNLKSKAHIIHSDIAGFSQEVDTVVMNPPFGTKEKHADKEFLEKAISKANTVYSLHKTSTIAFLVKLAENKGFICFNSMDFSFPLKHTMKHHEKKRKLIEVSCLCFKKLT